ncbi:MAG: LuxR C-terminal-related transcriptional regulator [Myxococcaceae bacterium]|nr:LuxR C-terminal-related transcriptional regulator [Myxococcaceae bacterium]
MRPLTFSAYHRQVRVFLARARALGRSSSDLEDFLARYESVLAPNQFLTVFDVAAYRYTRHRRVREVLGYAPEEFTGLALIGHGVDRPIIHPDDVPFYLHFGRLVHQLASVVPDPVVVLRDYGWFRFRLSHRNGALLAAYYLSFYFELDDERRPRSHVDIWSVTPLDVEARFEPDFGFFMANGFEGAKKTFHELNEAALGLRLTPQQSKIVTMLRAGLSRKEVAGRLHIAEGSVDSHFTTIRSNMNRFLERNGHAARVSSAIQLIAFAEKYKLLRDDPFR